MDGGRTTTQSPPLNVKDRNYFTSGPSPKGYQYICVSLCPLIAPLPRCQPVIFLQKDGLPVPTFDLDLDCCFQNFFGVSLWMMVCAFLGTAC